MDIPRQRVSWRVTDPSRTLRARNERRTRLANGLAAQRKQVVERVMVMQRADKLRHGR
jgi:hypothetical protein